MSTDTWARLASFVGGLLLAGTGMFDAFANHSAFAAPQGDLTLIYVGASVIVGKALYDIGVSVPPKTP
jgi:hypothetical protein